MFHRFGKYIYGVCERCGLQICAVPQTVSNFVRAYALGNRGTLEQTVFLFYLSRACVFHASGTRVEQMRNSLTMSERGIESRKMMRAWRDRVEQNDFGLLPWPSTLPFGFTLFPRNWFQIRTGIYRTGFMRTGLAAGTRFDWA
jgi:hypothetical protein